MNDQEWDKIPQEFNDWWDREHDDSGNPFREGSAAYWAWAGWKAALLNQKNQEYNDERTN